MKDIVIEVTDLKKVYKLAKNNVLCAVDDISFNVFQGECLGVIGESGCGKSTMARVIAGVEQATQGSIKLMDEEIAHLTSSKRKAIYKNMQMIFQNAIDVISPRMKIKTFLLEPLINYKMMSKQMALLYVVKILKKVRLTEEVLEKYPHQLSGGELQRVCIARAFSLNPKVLICDEITSALDVSVQDDVMKLFIEMQKEYGTACLFICHDLALVSQYTERVMVMYLGHIVEVLESYKLGSKALHPYTQSLMQSVLYLDTNRDRKIKTIEGEPGHPAQMTTVCPFCMRCSKATSRCYKENPTLKKIGQRHCVACFEV